ncbi:MAG: hypothetical protein GY913_04555 [Proteobacteria bacterium]|nr:hypothetical protein [Pseudomonadota bacterium]MCP4916173.1 hypothetical protein [Pseudomonadota bacterium]
MPPFSLLSLATASSTSLEPFDSCRGYDDALAEAVTEHMSYAYGGYWGYGLGTRQSSVAEAAPAAGATADGASAGPSSVTGTNNQEVGVDEQDIVKTDGRFLYMLNGTELAIVQSWPVQDAEKVGSVEIDGQASSLFLDGDRVMVLSRTYDAVTYQPGTKATVIDVTDRRAPQIVRTVDLRGQFSQARLIDGQAFLVMNSWSQIPQEVWSLVYDGKLDMPDIDYSTPESQEKSREVWQSALRSQVAEALATRPREERLLAYVDQQPGRFPRAGSALECDDVHTDGNGHGLGLMSVVNLDLHDDTAAPDASAIMGGGWTIYASTESMYVAETAWFSGWWGWGGTWDPSTNIHKFSLTGDKPEYRASGEIDGWLLNQFAMSEHDGNLRVAATEDDMWWGMGGTGQGSAVSVLRDNGDGELVVTGRVDGIAPGEQIYGVRFDGDRGYLVTFRQVDPLHVIDLSDASEPVVRGELQIPGYSSYLHPIEGGYLLAVGMDGDMQGRLSGLKISIFDVRDMDRPREIQKHVVGGDGWSWSEALYDHHAFTYRDGVLAIPAYTYDQSDWTYDSGLLVLDADPKRGIRERGRVSHSDLVGTGAWVNVRRSIFLDDVLVSISNQGVKLNDLERPKRELASIALGEGANHYYW